MAACLSNYLDRGAFYSAGISHHTWRRPFYRVSLNGIMKINSIESTLRDGAVMVVNRMKEIFKVEYVYICCK